VSSLPELRPTQVGAARVPWLDRLSDWQVAFGVIACGLLLYVPLAGTYGLWDPWETHYSEVARQMTKRGDFISLWWPGSPRDLDVFWSKPVLSFWLMSIGMHIAKIGLPGGMADEMAIGTRAEWAVRLPFCVMGVLGILAVYLVVARFVSRRAGLLSAVVAATSPMYSLVARQAMTDMAFVGPMSMALALGAMALFDDGDAVLPRRGRGRFTTWPHHWLFYLAIGLFALVTIPQLAIDSVQLKIELPWHDGILRMYGAVAMIPYYVGFALFIWLAARTRYKAPLYLYIAAILCGLSVLAKGLAGLGLPLIVFLAYLGFTWNWRRLRRAQLVYGVIASLVACAVVAVPWHHAMIIRHGWAFWNELFGDNHWRRMVLGRHGDRGTFEYFVRELGYAVWPWVALAPGALSWAVMRERPAAPTVAQERAQGIFWLGAIWFVSAYALVSMSMTKFHHYVLPALPGLAICIGCFLDDLLGHSGRRQTAAEAPPASRGATFAIWGGSGATGTSRRLALLVALGLPLLALVTADLVNDKNASQRFLWLFSYDYIHSPRGRPWPEALNFSYPLIVFAALFGIGTLALLVPRARRWAAVGLCGVGVLSTFFLLDRFMPAVAPFWSQKDVVAAYYRARRSPEERLIAFQMYWRGETFYTKNEIYEGPPAERTVFDQEGADERLKDYLARHRGRRFFFLMEKGQRSRVEGLLPGEARRSFQIVHDTNNKFILAQADL
jgi:4-amino-4-deoxy-L-arabinose transferase-like glycosyltransferase